MFGFLIGWLVGRDVARGKRARRERDVQERNERAEALGIKTRYTPRRSGRGYVTYTRED